ncbi:hypothetical protein SUGI_0361170 [Cryptomeria japonica]|nr:hypothetical protein SUGI_0361170 [Cryptomeria japonica]
MILAGVPLILLLLFTNRMVNGAGLKVGYYRHTCPEAEAIVSDVVGKVLRANPGLAPPLIRLHFHDCFVRGCDGSILLDSTPGNVAEKDAPANNPSLSGYDIIDAAKSRIEAKCPGLVSCADIVAFAARDSAHQVGGLMWAVEGGRRDGRISRASDTPGNLPLYSSDVKQLTQLFARKHLSQEDMVTLSGAHSIGSSHCAAFSDRLYNFSGRGGEDPSMDPHYALQLKAQCPPSNPPNVVVSFDPLTPNNLDVKYYVDLLQRRGLLYSDQTLMSNNSTSRLVKIYAKYPAIWRKMFGRAMVKMGSIDVLTGPQGEIRKQCHVPN